jgi:hypothetical protein
MNELENDSKSTPDMKKTSSAKVPETRNIRKITRASKNKQGPNELPILNSSSSPSAKLRKFSKPKDKTANIDVKSDCIEPNTSLELVSSKTRVRDNSSDQIKNIRKKRDRSSGAASHVIDVSHQLDKIKLDDIKEDYNHTPITYQDQKQESAKHSESNSENDVDMDNDKSQEADDSANIETRRTRRKIKKPEYLANNYQLEDNKDNKQPDKNAKPLFAKKGIIEEQKSAIVTRKSIHKVTKSEDTSFKRVSEKGTPITTKEPHIPLKTSKHPNLLYICYRAI